MPDTDSTAVADPAEAAAAADVQGTDEGGITDAAGKDQRGAEADKPTAESTEAGKKLVAEKLAVIQSSNHDASADGMAQRPDDDKPTEDTTETTDADKTPAATDAPVKPTAADQPEPLSPRQRESCHQLGISEQVMLDLPASGRVALEEAGMKRRRDASRAGKADTGDTKPEQDAEATSAPAMPQIAALREALEAPFTDDDTGMDSGTAKMEAIRKGTLQMLDLLEGHDAERTAQTDRIRVDAVIAQLDPKVFKWFGDPKTPMATLDESSNGYLARAELLTTAQRFAEKGELTPEAFRYALILLYPNAPAASEQLRITTAIEGRKAGATARPVSRRTDPTATTTHAQKVDKVRAKATFLPRSP